MTSRELDLIPASYRERLKIKHWCHLFLLAFILIVVAIVIAKMTISYQTDSLKTDISKLQKDQSFNLQQQQTYNTLLLKQNHLQKKLEILNGLRGGPTVKKILQAIDRVIDGNVWFTHWSFNRAGELTVVKPQTVQTGYFIIIPEDITGSTQQQAWRLNSHMEIKGQARNHSSLSKFVSALLKQAEISDVKVIKTALRATTEGQVINFDLVVMVNNNVGKTNVL